jgi:hypothetical protein
LELSLSNNVDREFRGKAEKVLPKISYSVRSLKRFFLIMWIEYLGGKLRKPCLRVITRPAKSAKIMLRVARIIQIIG